MFLDTDHKSQVSEVCVGTKCHRIKQFIIPLSQVGLLMALKSLQQSKFSQMVLDYKGSATIKNFLNVVCVNSTCVKGFTTVSTVPFGISLGDSFFQLQISFYNFLQRKKVFKDKFLLYKYILFCVQSKKKTQLNDFNSNDIA